MVRVKSNKVLAILLIKFFLCNALIMNIGAMKTAPPKQKIGVADVGQSDSIMVQRCSFLMLIDNLEAALNDGHLQKDTLDKIVAVKGYIYRAGLQESIIAESNGTKNIIDKKLSPIKINAPPIIGDNSRVI